MSQRFLRGAAILTLVALGLMVWSVLQPTPMPVLLAMSVGQVLGTAAFAMFGYVVLRDVRRQYVRRRDAQGERGTSGQVPVIAELKAVLDEPAAQDSSTAAVTTSASPPDEDAPP